jgi:3-phenylpropionate/trans-cinnamate dioxygenase ferredoxin reductase subunit
MTKLHAVRLNGETFNAPIGSVLLDAALMAGIDIPFDCRAGRCGTCLMRIARGRTIGGETHQRDFVHACQARVLSDLELQCEPRPPVGRIDGRLQNVTELGRDVVQVEIAPAEPVPLLPGQYYRFKFRGFPTRCFSPTLPLNHPPRGSTIYLNVKRVGNGRVSTKLGKSIRPGHRVTLEGPFGTAYLRRRQKGRLVLVAGGTGFAPIWSIANAALSENPYREMVVVAGSRDLPSLYMAPGLERLTRFPNVQVIPCSEAPHPAFPKLPTGLPSDHLPALREDDNVHAAGAPKMVAKVAEAASQADASIFVDPFEADANRGRGWLASLAG